MGFRVELSKENQEKFDSLEATLNKRGVKSFDRNEVINTALSKMKSVFWDDIAQEQTPLEWKLKIALQDEKAKKDIEKILKNINLSKASELEDV